MTTDSALANTNISDFTLLNHFLELLPSMIWILREIVVDCLTLTFLKGNWPMDEIQV